MAWYYQRGGTVIGPISSAELKEAARLGRIDAETAVRRDTDEQWHSASKIRGLEFDELIFGPRRIRRNTDSSRLQDTESNGEAARLRRVGSQSRNPPNALPTADAAKGEVTKETLYSGRLQGVWTHDQQKG
jgi:hypothetical protein